MEPGPYQSQNVPINSNAITGNFAPQSFYPSIPSAPPYYAPPVQQFGPLPTNSNFRNPQYSNIRSKSSGAKYVVNAKYKQKQTVQEIDEETVRFKGVVYKKDVVVESVSGNNSVPPLPNLAPIQNWADATLAAQSNQLFDMTSEEAQDGTDIIEQSEQIKKLNEDLQRATLFEELSAGLPPSDRTTHEPVSYRLDEESEARLELFREFDKISVKHPEWKEWIDQYIDLFGSYLTSDKSYEIRQLIDWIQKKMFLQELHTSLGSAISTFCGTRTMDAREQIVRAQLDLDKARRLSSTMMRDQTIVSTESSTEPAMRVASKIVPDDFF